MPLIATTSNFPSGLYESPHINLSEPHNESERKKIANRMQETSSGKLEFGLANHASEPQVIAG